jgi:hypothetical protein
MPPRIPAPRSRYFEVGVPCRAFLLGSAGNGAARPGTLVGGMVEPPGGVIKGIGSADCGGLMVTPGKVPLHGAPEAGNP